MPKTLKQWLNSARLDLERLGIARAQSDSLILLSYALVQNKAYIIAHQDDTLFPEQEVYANKLLKRRLAHEPIAYIIGEKEFFGLYFRTDARGLIPRWETELLVETALKWLKDQDLPQIVADIGTGCGTILLTLASHYPSHTYIGVDISPGAIALAEENANQLNTPSVELLEGDLAQPLMPQYKQSITLLTANLPYISTKLLTHLDPTISYFEPDLALNGGDDGLDLYRRFLPQAKELLAPNSMMLLEHDHDQGRDVRDLSKQFFPNALIVTLKDGLGHDRVLQLVNQAP